MQLITRKEVQAILGFDTSRSGTASTFHRLWTNNIPVEKKEIRNGRAYNLYDKAKIIALKKRLSKNE